MEVKEMDRGTDGLPTWLGRTLSVICLILLFAVVVFAMRFGLFFGLGIFVAPALLLTLLYALVNRDGEPGNRGSDEE
jgi:hypothetical protein